MSRKSKNTVYEIGNIYMSGMNEQMSRHFETVIKLRFDQVSGVVSVVSTDNKDRESLYEELIYRTQVRGFDYLALCSAKGDFQTLYGQSIQPLNPEPFVEALLQGEQRVAVGVDADGNEVVLFGVDAVYPMHNGDSSTGEGIGIQFNMAEDTLLVIQPVSGGPSEKVGILAGDRIVMVEDTLIAGVKMSTEDIMPVFYTHLGYP